MADIRNKLTPKEAQAKIREIAKLGSIIPSQHIYISMRKRSFDMQDVEAVLGNGIVKEIPVFDEEYDNWKYKVEGTVIEGDKAVVITAIISHREILAITIIGAN